MQELVINFYCAIQTWLVWKCTLIQCLWRLTMHNMPSCIRCQDKQQRSAQTSTPSSPAVHLYSQEAMDFHSIGLRGQTPSRWMCLKSMRRINLHLLLFVNALTNRWSFSNMIVHWNILEEHCVVYYYKSVTRL